MDVDFEPGDDVERYLVTSDPAASTWQVFVREPDGREQPARRVHEGWLSHARPLRAREVAWNVGLGIMQPEGTEVVIRRPGEPDPVVLPHPGAWKGWPP